MKAKELRAARAGFVQQQIEAGEAVQVFPSTDRESLASIYAIGARDFQSTTELLENVQNDPDVANCYVAPPRHILSRASGALRGTPNKAASPTHWGMEALGLSGTPDCSGVMVAVVDSGVDSDHADLQNAIASVENFTTDPDRDLDGHGTHVCGIIAGRGVPPAGMRGVCNAQLAVFKGLGRQYDATAYYRALGAALDRCRIVNLSLGGEGEDLTESLLIEDALRSGVVVVAAMGNDYESGNATHFPAAIDGVIAVGAETRRRFGQNLAILVLTSGWLRPGWMSGRPSPRIRPRSSEVLRTMAFVTELRWLRLL